MTMKRKIKPVHPGRFLHDEFMEPVGISQYRLAQATGLSQVQVGNIVRDQPLLEKAKQEAEFYLGKEKSAVTAKLIARIKQDPRFGLAAVG